MPRTPRFVLASAMLATLALTTLAPSQDAAPGGGQPVDFISPLGSVALQQEIQRLRTEAKGAEAKRAKADGDDTPSVAYLRAVREIWDDDRLRDTPWIIEAGKDILNIHRYRYDHQRRLDTSVEILAVIDANRERWLAMVDTKSTREQMAQHIDGQIITILSGMQGAANAGRPEIELAALERLIAMATDDKIRENLIAQRDHRRDRMAMGLHGPEEPPAQWRIP